MSILDYLNKNFAVRKAALEKESFRNYIIEYLREKGIEARTEQTSDGKNNNLVVGDPTKAKTELGWNPQTTSYEELVRLMSVHDRAKAEEELRVKKALES